MIKLTAIITILFCLVFTGSASAAKCLGKPAKTIGKSGKISVKRGTAVVLTGSRPIVKADGDTRVCSTNGNVYLTFTKGFQNQAKLGSGNDTVQINYKANINNIDLGDGNNSIVIKNKANKHLIKSGSGNDKIVVAYKSNLTSISSGAGHDNISLNSKANEQIIKSGNGNDKIVVNEPAKANKRTIYAGLGDDNVNLIAQGHTTTYLSDKENPNNLSDTDSFSGNTSNDTVFDYQGGTDAKPNLIHGNNGFDKLWSLKNARTDIYGGDGTDYIYSSSTGVGGDRLFGDRGNDKHFADQAPAGADVKGVFIDGGEGDDWYYGSAGDDTMVSLAGIKKIYGKEGNDTIIRTGNGLGTIEGGGGRDTLSYAAHTPPGYWVYSGIMIDLQQGKAMNGKGIDTIADIEVLVGSPYDDQITGSPSGRDNIIYAGLGNDTVDANFGEVDGGLGFNTCQGRAKTVFCNDNSPGEPEPDNILIDIGPEGILNVIGSPFGEKIDVGYDSQNQGYVVNTNSYDLTVSGLCRYLTSQNSPGVFCPAAKSMLTTLSVNAHEGNDTVIVRDSVPADVATVLSGDQGYDTVDAKGTRDFISQFESGNTGDGNDIVNLDTPGAKLYAGKGSDTLHAENPCIGGFLSGGEGKDGLVFAGADYGVKGDLRTRTARWANRGCNNPLKLANDLEGLEGSKHNDILIGNKNRKTSYLGRDGHDTFNAKNGIKETITLGETAKGNTVIRDKFDRVIYGWGLAAF